MKLVTLLYFALFVLLISCERTSSNLVQKQRLQDSLLIADTLPVDDIIVNQFDSQNVLGEKQSDQKKKVHAGGILILEPGAFQINSRNY